MKQNTHGSIRIVQNIISLALILIGTVVFIGGYVISGGYLIGSVVLVLGLVRSMYLIIRRRGLRDNPKIFNVVFVSSILCWSGFIVSTLILFLYPSFYGFDLEIIANWSVPAFWMYFLAFGLTSVELFRTIRR